MRHRSDSDWAPYSTPTTALARCTGTSVAAFVLPCFAVTFRSPSSRLQSLFGFRVNATVASLEMSHVPERHGNIERRLGVGSDRSGLHLHYFDRYSALDTWVHGCARFPC